MAISSSEISDVIKQRLKDFGAEIVSANVGRVITVSDGIAQIFGLTGVMAGELIQFPGDVFGLALNLEEDQVRAVIMGPYEHIQEGDEVRTTGRIVEVPVGPELLGRTVSPLGEPLDGRGPIQTARQAPIEVIAPGVITRKRVDEPVQTGIVAIDAMFAIGRGQRELVIGDRQTGKTALLLDTIINQKGKDLFCIYVAIGQNAANIARVRATLEERGAMEYTTIVAASASDPAAVNYIAPYAGCAMGEYFRDKGQHALICYDDLTKHAWAYRELSLTLRRPPGREAYPGDVFYLHSRLLERACKLSDEKGGGSLTALPFIETQAGDVSAYIPTNVISITDGQIFLETDLFYSGVRPAINVGLSVSRVGSAAQIKAMKQVAGGMKLALAQYRELAAFAQFGSDLDKATQETLAGGERLVEILKQGQYEPMPQDEQVLQIYAATNRDDPKKRGWLRDVPLPDVQRWAKEFIDFVKSKAPAITQEIREKKELSNELKTRINQVLGEFNTLFQPTPAKS